MIKKIISSFIFLTLVGCEKSDSSVSNLYSKVALNMDSAKADGKSEAVVEVYFTKETSVDRRSVVLSLNTGVFSNGTKEIIVKAEYDEGKLVARATLKMPFSGEWLKVTASPEYDSPIKEYTMSDSLKLIKALTDSVRLETSSYGIKSNFKNEIRLTAFLLSKGGQVSSGEKVRFDQTTNNSAVGKFRKMQTASSDSSKVTSFYSAPNLPVGSTITITATYVDAKGISGDSDSIILTINE